MLGLNKLRSPAVAVLLAGCILVACGAEAWERDPVVRAAKQACKGLNAVEEYGCIERRAVESLDPDVCRLAGIYIDDMCLQAVYEAANDPSICERIYLLGVRPNCRAYYDHRPIPAVAPRYLWTLPPTSSSAPALAWTSTLTGCASRRPAPQSGVQRTADCTAPE
jgi:hypothetical protein